MCGVPPRPALMFLASAAFDQLSGAVQPPARDLARSSVQRSAFETIHRPGPQGGLLSMHSARPGGAWAVKGGLLCLLQCVLLSGEKPLLGCLCAGPHV